MGGRQMEREFKQHSNWCERRQGLPQCATVVILGLGRVFSHGGEEARAPVSWGLGRGSSAAGVRLPYSCRCPGVRACLSPGFGQGLALSHGGFYWE